MGAALGALLTGILTDKMGRKPMIVFSDILLIIGSGLLWGSTSIQYLMAGRFIVGLGMGVSILASSVYLAEVAPTKLRGAFVSSYHVMVALGILLSFLTVAFTPSWNVVLGLSMIPALL